MDFIMDHYLVIMIIVAFIVFALIGFIVDSSKNKKKILEEAEVEDEKTVVIPDAFTEETELVNEPSILEVVPPIIEETLVEELVPELENTTETDLNSEAEVLEVSEKTELLEVDKVEDNN